MVLQLFRVLPQLVVFFHVAISAQEINFDETCNRKHRHHGTVITIQEQGHFCKFYNAHRMKHSSGSDFKAHISTDDQLVLTWDPLPSYSYHVQVEGRFQPRFDVHTKTKRCLHISANETRKHHYSNRKHNVSCLRIQSDFNGTISVFVQKCCHLSNCQLADACSVTSMVLNYVVVTEPNITTTSKTTTTTTTTFADKPGAKEMWIYTSIPGAIVVIAAIVTVVVFVLWHRREMQRNHGGCCCCCSRQNNRRSTNNDTLHETIALC